MRQAPASTSHALRHAALLGAAYAVVGVSQPFLPAFLTSRGLDAGEVSIALALGSAVRLLVGPMAGRLADSLHDPRLLLAATAAASALAACGFLLAAGVAGILLAQLMYSTVLAPLVPLSETVTLAAARRGLFDYGRVRAVGSATFILASALAGWLVGRQGYDIVPVLLALMLALSALAAMTLRRTGEVRVARPGSFRAVLALPGLGRLMLVSALVQGSHAALYAFGAIHWAAAGHAPLTIGLLWAGGVIAEILLFTFGHALVERLGLRGLSLVAALAGVVRWGLLAGTVWLPALAVAQLLHGLTFGAQYLASMRLLISLVPPGQAATAQSLHASLGVGVATALLTLVCGPLYASWGGGVFWLMAALCGLAVPVALGLRAPVAEPAETP